MSLRRRGSLSGMTPSTYGPTTVSNIGVAMFSVADQDAARAFYTEKLGWEVRGDDRFGENGEMRWLEVAPPGSTARLALNPPMEGEPGGSAIGVETADVHAEYARLSAIDGVTIANPPMEIGGAPPMFSIADPDGNHIWIVQTPPAS
jgi:lactoylglutathione lyase